MTGTGTDGLASLVAELKEEQEVAA